MRVESRDSGPSRPGGGGQGAFTLMELLVVCLLIAVMAAMIVPEMKSSFEDALLRSTSRKLVDVFSLTYSRAVSLNEIHRVRLDQHSGQYVIERQVGDGFEDADFEPASEIAQGQGQLDPRISIALQKVWPEGFDDSDAESDPQLQPPPSDDLFFYPDGTADGCEILLRDRMGFQLLLQINPNTARVQVVEPSGEGMTKSE